MARDYLKIALLVFLFVSLNRVLKAQCINSYPNVQDFENGPVWTPGGLNSDWAWGTPAKSIITAAGGGYKCWIIGGLTSQGYAGGQQSYIESPCYDFTNLSSPSVSFKIFWEMEYHYDGGALQYSINNGASWATIGSASDLPNCMNDKWVNYGSVNYLSWCGSKNGWSGNSQPTNGSCQGGNGSLGWVTATHCLANLAGEASVKFRFVFGSGTSCNNFDGFAIDDFKIENAVIAPVTFSNTCTSFTSVNAGCMIPTSYVWNFGDPNSGASNTSTLSNSNHNFSAAGSYSVSLTTSNAACQSSFTYTKVVNVLGSTFANVHNVSCKGGNDGSATVVPQNGNGVYSYTWTPGGEQGTTAFSLTAGDYSVIVTDGNGCTSTNTLSITEPESSTGVTSQTITGCVGDNISMNVIISGITDPVTYLWSPGNYTTAAVSVTPLANTVYTVDVSISGNCAHIEQKFFTTLVSPKPLLSFTTSGLKGCAPFCVNLYDNSTTESGTIGSQQWNFSDGSSSELKNASFCFSKAGIYTGSHMVDNSYGCSSFSNSSITVTVLPSPSAEFIADKYDVTELDPLVNFTDQSSQDVIKWDWDFGGLNDTSSTKDPLHAFNEIGDYPVWLTVTNIDGCTNSVMREIKVLPEFTFFAPNSFSPNNDGINDIFLPKGMGWKTSTYKLWLYNRMGEKVFYTQDYSLGWDGKISGNDQYQSNDVYTWKVELVDINGKFQSLTGHVTLLR